MRDTAASALATRLSISLCPPQRRIETRSLRQTAGTFVALDLNPKGPFPNFGFRSAAVTALPPRNALSAALRQLEAATTDAFTRRALQAPDKLAHRSRCSVRRGSLLDFSHQCRPNNRRVRDSTQHGHVRRQRNPKADRDC